MVSCIMSTDQSKLQEKYPEWIQQPYLMDHDYSVRTVNPDDLPRLKTLECKIKQGPPPLAIRLGEKFFDFAKNIGKVEDEDEDSSDSEASQEKLTDPSLEEKDDPSSSSESTFAKQFSKCDKCRKSRTKVLVPNALLSLAQSKNDGVTCDFCGAKMSQFLPQTLPNVFEGRRGSKGGDLMKRLMQNGQESLTESDLLDLMLSKSHKNQSLKSYVYCGECQKVVLKESLSKHMRDVHQKSNKRQCHICSKILSGPFSLKEHISAVHNKVTKYRCPHCDQMFAHFSNMSRHIRLVHEKMVITHKYVNCVVCNKVVQATSLKKHMTAIHEGRKDFVCTYCNKGFAQSYTLKEHIVAKHTHKFSHVCIFCKKSFSHKTNACRHVRTVHKNQIDGSEQEGNILKKYITYCENHDDHETDQDAVKMEPAE